MLGAALPAERIHRGAPGQSGLCSPRACQRAQQSPGLLAALTIGRIEPLVLAGECVDARCVLLREVRERLLDDFGRGRNLADARDDEVLDGIGCDGTDAFGITVHFSSIKLLARTKVNGDQP